MGEVAKPFNGIIFYGENDVLPYNIEGFQFWEIPLKSLI
jgi:hypothetical protein